MGRPRAARARRAACTGASDRAVGYWIHRGYVRRGFATAAARALATRAFGLPGVERVEIHNDRANVLSAHIPRRLAFELVGEHEHPPTAPAETGVRQLWRIERARWDALAAAR